MKLYIEKGTSVEDLKRIFTMRYPYLKIELYKKPFKNSLNPKKELLPGNAPLHKYLHASGKTCIDIHSDTTVAQLEKQFEDAGINAEVFRKSGKVWIETSLTDNWALDQQNAEAEELSNHVNNEKNFSKRSV